MSTRNRYLERPFALKAIEANGTFSGYASVFGELDWYNDIVMPGAFQKTIAKFVEMKRKVPMLWQHNSREPIGVYTKLVEDQYGLYVEGECNMKVQQGQECHSLLEQGALSGLSIGYDTVSYTVNTEKDVRYLTEVDLWEVSPVTFPAGDSARVTGVKFITDLTTLSDCETLLRDAGFSKSEATAFVSKARAIATRSDSVGAETIKNTLSILQGISQ